MEQTDVSEDAGGGGAKTSGSRRGRSWWKRASGLIPRPETIFLLVSFAGTVAAKYVTVRPHEPERMVAEVAAAALTDAIFFASVGLLFAVLYAIRPGRMVARLVLVLSALIAVWSVLNAVWLVSTGVQLQPSVLAAIWRDAQASCEIAQRTAERTWHRLVVPGVFVGACGVWLLWRMIRPRAVSRDRIHHLRRGGVAAVVLGASVVGELVAASGGRVSAWGDAIGFNSHWYALIRTVSDATDADDVPGVQREIPRAGEREVTLPTAPREQMPNVVVVFLESVSHVRTSLGDPEVKTTPNIERLASEGVEFTSTHVMVPHTTKAFFTALTSNTPDLQHDAVEAVLVDEPYESLATLLGRKGYRSAFFEMSRGAWEGAPALFANMGFDWGWFRENLEDESAHVGWQNGDDFRMIEPMFQWAERGEEPFLLAMITSVAHDPYDLPTWFEPEPKSSPYRRYLRALEYTDQFLGAVMGELEKRGLEQRTLLCVLGDHGEVFRPESKRGRWVSFEEAIRIPWIIRWPGHVEAGRKVAWPCAQADVTPTILSLLGYGIEEAGFEGMNALEPIESNRRMFFSSWFGNAPKGYLEGDLKYVHLPYTDTVFVYNLATDPDEHAPAEVTGERKTEIVSTIQAWERASFIRYPARRFRERMLYDHWRTHSTGRVTTTYYVSSGGR